MNEIPDDENVTDEAGLLQNIDFIIEALDQLGIGSGAFAVALVQTFVTKFAQICFARFAFGRRILRIFRATEFQLEIAAIRNRDRVRNRLGKIRKQCAHFVRRFEIQLRHVTHATLVRDQLARADANHHVVRFVVPALEKMHVVRRHQADAKFLRQLRQHGVAFVLRFDAVIVHLEEKILPRRKYRGNSAVLCRAFARSFA